MLSYQVLDRVADTHNPLLGVFWISLALVPLWVGRWRVTVSRFALGVACLLCAYGYMWLDAGTSLWARMGLDYSTHTGVAVALAAAIWGASQRLGILACGLIALYIPLMVYQGYHTSAHIFTSAIAVGLPAAMLVRVARAHTRTNLKPAANNSFNPMRLRRTG